MRTLINFRIFKEASALSLRVIPPVWSTIQTKTGPAHAISKPGSLLFELFPTTEKSSQDTSVQRYRWNESKNIALSALELGSLTLDVPKDGIRFLRPQLRSGMQKYAVFTHNGIHGYNLQIGEAERELYNPDGTDELSIRLTHGEMATIKILCTSTIPFILGWTRTTEGFENPDEHSGEHDFSIGGTRDSKGHHSPNDVEDFFTKDRVPMERELNQQDSNKWPF